jgi:hypothetical protein
MGQAAWIYEKFLELAGDGISCEDVLTSDEDLDDVTLCRLTATDQGRHPGWMQHFSGRNLSCATGMGETRVLKPVL